MDVPTISMNTTKFLLDSGDPEEYKELNKIAKEAGSAIWGSTTNPSLIAKKLAAEGKKLTRDEAFALQKQIVLDILELVPGAVSAEVYADKETTADEMIAQGREIATWHQRVVVKLPTTLEAFKARTALRLEGIQTNNTLVFSQQQIFAICLHEQIIQKTNGPTNDMFAPFISPFVGRLDDIGLNGMHLVEHGMQIKNSFSSGTTQSALSMWMLSASIRSLEHMKRTIAAKSELITAPLKTYKEWYSLPVNERESLSATPNETLTPIDFWQAPDELKTIDTIDAFMEAIETKKLDISHELTDKGIDRFAADWQAILAS
jgi:transaldolase